MRWLPTLHFDEVVALDGDSEFEGIILEFRWLRIVIEIAVGAEVRRRA